MRIKDKITSVQDKVLGSFNQKTEMVTRTSFLFNKLKRANLTSLGEVGISLEDYFLKINDHPEVSASVNEEFMENINSLLFDETNEKAKTSLLSQKNVIRSLNKIKPRFISDPSIRKTERELKNQVHNLNLKQIYNLGDNGYYNFPDNFDIHIRRNESVGQEIEELNKTLKVFKNNKMEEVARTIKSRISALEKIDNYLGFYKIKPDEAATILARMYELNFHEWNFITVDFDFFAQAYWKEQKKEEEESQIKRLTSAKDRKIAAAESSSFLYQPRLYPFHKFADIPKKVENIISETEVLCNGYPAFDYYWIVVPSINVNHHYFKTKDDWKIKTNEIVSYNDEYSAAFALDKALIEEGHFVPAVLGERDGVCYFLTLWN